MASALTPAQCALLFGAALGLLIVTKAARDGAPPAATSAEAAAAAVTAAAPAPSAGAAPDAAAAPAAGAAPDAAAAPAAGAAPDTAAAPDAVGAPCPGAAAAAAAAAGAAVAPGRVQWSPEDARGTKVALRCAIDSSVLGCIALAIVAVAWHEQKWGNLLDVLDRAAGVFPAEVAFVRRLLG
jgi:hypothetical protein